MDGHGGRVVGGIDGVALRGRGRGGEGRIFRCYTPVLGVIEILRDGCR